MIGVELKGADKLKKKLQKETITEPLANGIKKITRELHRLVMVSTPVDTARLRSSMTFEIQPKQGKVGTNVEYAPFVEFGTRHMQARHVLEGSSRRVKGKGMFAKGAELVLKKMGDLMKEIGVGIQSKFG